MRDRMVVFGGYDGGYRNDAWALSLAGSPAWSLLTPSGTPPPGRYEHTAIYDPVRDRMVVLGGWGGSYRNDVWALSLAGSPAWSLLTPAGTPPSVRSEHTAIYDPVRDRMVVFGGHGGGPYLSDVRALSLAGSPAWSLLTPAGNPPSARSGEPAIYDPVRDRMVVFGGNSSSGLRNDVWTLTWGFSTSLCPVRNEIVSFDRGPGTSLTNAWQSVGPPEGQGTPLGYQGRLVLRFPNGITNGPGSDLVVYEFGHSGPPAIDENYRVEASVDGNTYVILGEAPGDFASFDLAAGGLSLAYYIRITDLPPFEQAGIPGYDPTVVGADIDAVVALHCPTNEINCANGVDDDGDGPVDCADPDCGVDSDGDGYAALPCGTDCNDRNAAVHPGAVEICGNGPDDNCNGLADCQDGPCQTADADGDGILDCSDSCPKPGDLCQWFVPQHGAVPDPDQRYDIVVAADLGMPGATWEADLEADITAIYDAFVTLPGIGPHLQNVTFWRAVRRTSHPYHDIREQVINRHFDAIVVRIPSGSPCLPGSTQENCTQTFKTNHPYAVVGTDPEQDVVPALHELGHAAFGLADEYWGQWWIVPLCGAKGCKNRAQPVRFGEKPPNVWSNLSDCETARSRYCFTAPCYEFCDHGGGGSWRLGDGDNPNLMRADCEPSGTIVVNGYGEAGNLRVKQLLGMPDTPCFAPNAVATPGDDSLARTLSLDVRFESGIAVAESLRIDAGVVPPGAPGGTPIYLRFLDRSGAVLRSESIWDPRFQTVHDSLPELGPVHAHIVLGFGGAPDAWQLMDRDSLVLGGGSLSTEFLDYCRRINFTDADCFAGGGPVAVTPASAPTTVRLLPAWPNPTRGSVFLRLDLPRREPVSVGIFDLTGRRLRTLAKGGLEPGIHTLEWDSKDDDGRALPAGVYFCAVNVGTERFRRTIILVR